MKTNRIKKTVGALLISLAAQPALAQSNTAQEVAAYAYSNGLMKGANQLKLRLETDTDNADARFGLGILQFLAAIEGLQQDLYRHGVGNQQVGANGRGLSAMLPILRIPVPPNANPEIASYQKVRTILERFVTRLNIAKDSLKKVGDGPAKIPLTLEKIWFDANADGKFEQNETMKKVLASLTNPRRRSTVPSSTFAGDIAFDTADAKWLMGYSNVLTSIANFLLSFDFEKSYDVSFHAIFGHQATAFGQALAEQVGDPEEIMALQKELDELNAQIKVVFPASLKIRDAERRRKNKLLFADKTLSSSARRSKLKELQRKYSDVTDARNKRSLLYKKRRETQQRLSLLTLSGGSGNSVQTFADPVSFLHSVSWKVVEHDRLKQVRQDLKEVARLNRETWRLVRAEKDNDREWLPNAKQTSPFATLKVTDDTIDAWLATVTMMEKVLDGEIMAPTWRFGRGMNMKRFFESAKSFDLILFLTGPNSIEFVEKGPILDQGMMRGLNRPFGRNFNSYALWFN